MRRWFFLLLCACLAVVPLGCGGSQDRGINKDKDKPKAGDKP
jgi:hypothetical protein